MFARVWKVTKNEKYIDFRISTSEKDQNDNRKYSTWFPRAIGHALNSLKDVKEGDCIRITKVKFADEGYKKDDGTIKSSLRVLILEATVADQGNTTASPAATEKKAEEKPAEKDESDCPW